MDTLARVESGARLRERREERGWSQRRLQNELRRASSAKGQPAGVTVQMISRWENGHKAPARHYQRLLAEVLGPRSELTQGRDLERRRFLGQATTVTSAAVAEVLGAELWELTAAMRPTQVTDRALEYAELSVARLHELHAKFPPGELLPCVHEHLRGVTKLLQASQPIAYRRRLCSVAGHLAGLRAWLSFDLDDQTAAAAWYEAALQPALEAGDDALCGWLLGAHSLLPLYSGEPSAALALVERGRHHAERSANATTRAWTAGLEARARAAVGDGAGFRQAQREAEQAAAGARPEERRHGMDFRDGELAMAYYEGNALLLLGEPAGARHALERALEAQGPRHVKGRSVVQLGLASTYALEQELEEACRLAGQALALPADQLIGPIQQRATDFRRLLAPWSSTPEVRDLDELLVVR